MAIMIPPGIRIPRLRARKPTLIVGPSPRTVSMWRRFKGLIPIGVAP